ncbi:hypothetical protein NLL29_08250 [Corynebacterium pseudodiphtheriticum]|uniref:hypothetical protein n=1 Tax=Corynebacterium pseudodiphtheriticum TaxID=37637 RepID=UPI002670571F|nr:hypothetical protein [Corynebacterium pseudodiphtheriticum]WKS29675.1 hypothetical protein NLL29_08250 [Corynebacterium pseudodiphtheriticum]WKS50620.1 hypothetical protein NLL37_05490 [Corynebacterium pseudodiphtheriticum]
MGNNKIPCPQLDPRCGSKSAKIYRCINFGLCGLLVVLFAAGVIVPLSGEEQFSGELILTLAVFVFLFLIHFHRANWLKRALKEELKIVDDASAYELERLALLTWLGVVVLTAYRCNTSGDEDITFIELISDWLISSLVLSPIVTLVVSGWGKLYIESPKGKIFWPMCLQNNTK